MSKVYSYDYFKECIPHRYENLLIDRITLNDDGPRLSLNISNEDALGRHIFLKQRTTTERCLLPVFMMETLALGAIISEGRIPEDSLIVYVAIYNFQLHSSFPENTDVHGSMQKINSRTDFIRRKGQLFTDQGQIAAGDMMACTVSKEKFDSDDSSGGKQIEPPQHDLSIDIAPNPDFKHPSMYVINSLTHMDFENGVVVSRYTFPTDHPLVRGHFPSHPILMGVMQWMGIEDTLWAFSQHDDHFSDGKTAVSANADLLYEDGTVIAECKGFEGIIYKNVDPFLDQCEVTATKKVNFRGSISPGQTIFIRVHSIKLL